MGIATLAGACSSVLSLASLALSCPRWYSVALFFWVRLISNSISAILWRGRRLTSQAMQRLSYQLAI